MEENNSINNKKIITKIFNQYKIQLISDIDSIYISIQNNLDKFESKFNFEYLNKLFIGKDTIEHIIEFISILIEHKNIQIKENQINLKLILIPTLFNNNCIELNLNKTYQMKMIESIYTNNNYVYSISIFPSGNIVSVLNDKSIKIYDIHYKLIQNIKNAFLGPINYVDIKDENNFVACSDDKNIKTWIKNKKNFIINKIIKNAHNDSITKVIYFSNRNLISCSYDKTVKIWEENNKNYQLITILEHCNLLWSILLLNDKNILISSGWNGTTFWNINNFELIHYFKKVQCSSWNSLSRIDNDKIIIGQGKLLKIISLNEKRITKEINLIFDCIGICIIKEKKIFLIGGKSRNIMIYNYENYEYIQTIKNVHEDYIIGFIELKNSSIISFSKDNTLKIWSL